MDNLFVVPLASNGQGTESSTFSPIMLDGYGNLYVTANYEDDNSSLPTVPSTIDSPTSPLSAPYTYVVEAAFQWALDPVSGSYYEIAQGEDNNDAVNGIGYGNMYTLSKGLLYSDSSSQFERSRVLLDSTDAQLTGVKGLAGTMSRLQIFNGSTFDRIESLADNADGQADGVTGLVGTVSRPQLFNGVTYDRVVSLADNANGQAAQVTGLQGVVARLQAIDTQAGTFDRLGCEGTDQDANPALNAGVLVVNTHPRMWNGADYDRVRGNEDVSLQAPTAQAAASTVLSGDQTNYNARGIKLLVNVTAITSGDTLTVTLRGKDVVSGVYYTILASVAIGAVGSYPLTVFPGAPVSANVSANDQLPRTWDVEYATAGANPVTFSVGASVLL